MSKCLVCNGDIIGDGITMVRHCENTDLPVGIEPDAPVIYCSRLESGITVKNSRHEKPSQPWDVIVDRRSLLGNPYPMATEMQRDIVIAQYREWFDGKIAERDPSVWKALEHLAEIRQTYGKLNLFCWCAPKACHADVIKRWLEINIDVII